MKTEQGDLLSKVGVKRQLYAYRCWLAGLLTLLVLGSFVYWGLQTSLCIRNTGKELLFFSPLPPGQDFCIRFIHSVMKSPVEEWFQVRDGKIILDRTVYQDFGAGLPHEVSAGQRMEVANGMVTISGYNRHLPELTVRVGWVADHCLLLEHRAGQTPRAVSSVKGIVGYRARAGQPVLLATPRTAGKEFMAVPLRDLAAAGAALTFSVEWCLWNYCAPRPQNFRWQ